MQSFLKTNRRIIARIAIVIGALLILSGFLADVIGVGGQPDVFGWKQIAAIVVGALALGGGIIMGRGQQP